MTFGGEGEMNTKPIYAAGALLVEWSQKNDCYFSASLEASDGRKLTWYDIASSSKKGKGTNRVYNVEPGMYYIKVITGAPPLCPWSIKISGQ